MLYMVTFTINIPPNVSIYTIHGSYGYGTTPHIVVAAVGARDTSQYGASRQEDDGRAGKPTGKPQESLR